MPHLGRSEEELARYKTAPELHSAVLHDVLKCLGKTNAFAIVAFDRGVDALLNAIVDYPTLTSFAIARDPDWASFQDTPQRLHPIRQPVLLLSDGDDVPKAEQAARLCKHLLHCEAPSFTTTAKPEYYDNEAGRDMLLHFQAHHWKGACGLGLDRKAKVLTRPAGGVKAWEAGVDEMIDDDDETPRAPSPLPECDVERASDTSAQQFQR